MKTLACIITSFLVALTARFAAAFFLWLNCGSIINFYMNAAPVFVNNAAGMKQ